MNKTDLKVAVIGIPGKWSTEVLADKLAQQTGFRLVVDMAKVSLDLETASLWFEQQNLCELDGLVVKKISEEYSPNTLDRLEMLRIAEAQGVRVFSGAEQILRLIDRLSCTVTLRNTDIPMPKTLITEDIDAAFASVQRFGSAVFKPLFSTKARGMCVIESEQTEQQIRHQIATFQDQNPMMYIQQKLDLCGRDMGLVFLGGKYLGSYARVSQSDSWNTTIHSGGRYEPCEPSEDIIDMARRAQAPFAMDFTTVDVAESSEGAIVFEVSAFGGFKGALEGAGIDAAGLYSDYLLSRLIESKSE